MIAISTGHNNDRLDGTRVHLDRGAGVGRVRIYAGTRPAAGGTATNLLVEVPLTKPAGTVTGNYLVLTAANLFDLAGNSGVATWARLVNGNGDWNTDCDVGDLASSAEVKLVSTTILAGGKVAPTLMRFG